jgi:hypothetical protein
LQDVAESLAEIRGEILKGDVSFLQAVASYYEAGEEDEDEEEEGEPEVAAPVAPTWEGLSKAELLNACADRGVQFRKSWSKGQLQEALKAATARPAAKAFHRGKPPRLSKAARQIVNALDRP